MRGEDSSNTAATPIPSQRRLTHQIIKHWKSFQILQQTLSSSSSQAAARLCSHSHGSLGSGRLHCELVCILLLQTHRETDRFFAASHLTRASSVSAALLSTPSSNLRSATSSPRPQHYVSTLTSMGLLWLHAHTLPRST